MTGMSTLDTGDVPVVPQMTLLKWLWDRVKHHKKKIIGIIFALVGLVSTTVFQPLLIRELIDKHLVGIVRKCRGIYKLRWSQIV